MDNQEFEQLVAAWLEGRIGQADSDKLQSHLLESAEARSKFCQFAALDSTLHSMASGDVEFGRQASTFQPSSGTAPALRSVGQRSVGQRSAGHWSSGASMMWVQVALAASVVALVGAFAYQMGRDTASQDSVVSVAPLQSVDGSVGKTSSGHATLSQVANVTWVGGDDLFREGDVLPAGILELEEGVAEIDFFCGATIVVEGPARLDVESDWSVRLLRGRLRANVPPAARGFVVKAADSEIVDLGTEFALEVGPDRVNVAVVDGEIKLRGGDFDGDHLTTGQTQLLSGAGAGPDWFSGISTAVDVQRQRDVIHLERFEDWQAYSQGLRADGRLLAYYPIKDSISDRSVANVSPAGDACDGRIVGLVSRDQGRFGRDASSLGFERLGSRVRVRIDGEFDAFTFASWVKIESLDHLYNSLFMADGYENGEPHWQLHNDGRLMLSVMVDDTPGSGSGPLSDARLHRIYYTAPIWDDSMSGQWLHLASVYDPANRVVAHYVNGKPISAASISDKHYIGRLRIGAAEIGNWGQPFRSSAEFSVRNLNGKIDELAIFGAALDAAEIQTMFQMGKPVGY